MIFDIVKKWNLQQNSTTQRDPSMFYQTKKLKWKLIFSWAYGVVTTWLRDNY